MVELGGYGIEQKQHQRVIASHTYIPSGIHAVPLHSYILGAWLTMTQACEVRDLPHGLAAARPDLPSVLSM
jgi:hypothetical protein